MALPQTLVPSAPLGSASPQGGDDELRGIKQLLADVFGLPVSPTSITNAVSAITSAGEMSRRRAPIKAVTAAYSLTLDDEIILLNKATADSITPLAAASAPGKYYKLKNINTGTWTWSGTVTIGGTPVVNPTLPQGDTLEVWCDGTTYLGLLTSATPAVGIVPLSGAGNTLARGFIPDNVPGLLTGEVTAESSVTSLTVNVETTLVSLDLGSVTVGDRVLININGRITKGGTAGVTQLQLYGSGTGGIYIGHNQYIIKQRSVLASEVWGYEITAYGRVVTSGTMVLQHTGTSFGSGSSLSAGSIDIAAVFLKKQ